MSWWHAREALLHVHVNVALDDKVGIAGRVHACKWVVVEAAFRDSGARWPPKWERRV